MITAKLFVGNLNYATTADELRALFSEIGEVQDVFVPTDRNTGRPRGFAFVQFEDAENAAEAVKKLDGHNLGGRQIRISEAQERDRRSGPPSGSSGPSQSRYSGPPPMPFDDAPSDRGGFDRWNDGGGGGGGGGGGKSKGSRRNLRGKKRSL